MMDRYLFRGKRVDNGEWIKGNYLSGIFFKNSPQKEPIPYIMTSDYVDDYDCWADFEDGYGYYEVDPTTIGQCMGLRDKNGKLIFEGDIITTTNGVMVVVEWEKESRFLGFTVGGERKIVYINREPLVEIIGNIHDNPELLERGAE